MPLKMFPEFERLEHLGSTRKTAEFVKALTATLKRKEAGCADPSGYKTSGGLCQQVRQGLIL
jgi:hypothetical protein